MPRPEVEMVTFTIDGREVTAPQNAMLVDGAKFGDVEIPVFCYEPKLGAPVGACRMCLVEIEGIPKLQTACSTPVKDGMVVTTQSERVKTAQQAVVEFLLINHPLDCPVCDKGGECPLQDISYGWGGGRSRFIEPKRHFVKPLALSPLIAIDRERCILCYRCVRFSQEVAEDYQLVFQERGAHTFVGTFDGHPYVAPFSGNIIELCPVGALTSQPYRFRARPWDVESAAGVCTLCPAQCNVQFTVRDERVMRVMARDHEGVDDGWLCDKGRFAYQAIHVDERITRPLLRDAGRLREVPWEVALDTAAGMLRRAGAETALLAGGETTNEEGFLAATIARQGLGTADLDSRTFDGLGRDALAALYAPELQASVADLEFAHTVLVVGTEPVDDAPILDLRLRKGVRRRGVQLAVATPRPSSLDPNAKAVARMAPGGETAFVEALAAALFGGDVDAPARRAGAVAADVEAIAALLRTGGDDVVILYGERVLRGGEAAVAALLKLAGGLRLRERPGTGLLGIPAATNGRGLREVGVLPDAGSGLAALERTGRGAAQVAAEGATAVWLLGRDPLADAPERAAWERTLERATSVIAHAAFLTEGLREHANVIFPAESYAEKEGTVTHPDGRLQRLRPAIARQGDTRPGWWVLTQLAKRLGVELPGAWHGPAVSQLMFDAVPVYAGLTLDRIGGKGLRWVEDAELAAVWPQVDAPAVAAPAPEGSRDVAAGKVAQGTNGAASDEAPPSNGTLRLGTFRSIWSGPEVEVSPALKFLVPKLRAELSPEDAARLGVRDGERVVLGSNGHRVHAVAALRAAVPAGSVFVEGNRVEGATVEVSRP
jgi:NADH-quinone oxidoreductase subunit G